jgi:hypothetical protein
MKVKVYYQDFQKNALCLGDDSKLVFHPSCAQFMIEVDVKLGEEQHFDGNAQPINKVDKEPKEPTDSKEDKQRVVDYCFWLLNCSAKAMDSIQPQAKKIGHTSMSVGDYIEFPDGEIWICKSTGWAIVYKTLEAAIDGSNDLIPMVIKDGWEHDITVLVPDGDVAFVMYDKDHRYKIHKCIKIKGGWINIVVHQQDLTASALDAILKLDELYGEESGIRQLAKLI